MDATLAIQMLALEKPSASLKSIMGRVTNPMHQI